MIMNNFSKKKKIISGSVLLIVSVLLVYILVDQFTFFTNKSEITGFISKYMRSIEGINMLSADCLTTDDKGVKRIGDKKKKDFRDFYKKYYFANDSNKEKLKYTFNTYDSGIQNILDKKGALKQFNLKSFKIISTFKIPFASHITAKVSYTIDYKANGSICYFDGTDILAIQSGSIDEELSASNHIQATFYLKKVDSDWKISRIPRLESTNISD
ncbi:hypothetical protein Cpap_4183 [Ruminiclostridium papyrosolvens DSM 2782]|uniref:Uncharacterized protein n=2 Tax=Ruminiclostridium papyrosolvens TaxID=29362 RepID=F1T8E3_9FIRM|nr:hypothetical protein [Ruminiclostridium papyrosolvens]EGD49741.1 hypothetical protein Cpap_4183 [Ruminiclostridium papyrosolvens DSM 2782]WES33132.1 hypothetical protein P0092_15365 [Ruminiclostridium papyrosolvens DSM 2782]